ncbi:metalloregulator ArsR/SmtB family transcription factor [Brasilonema bromeliae]|uniref:ArsR family transcriptional regulator n=1 Tax=Brasilonema bromeliae SPC951 TaxID=385972 RepID=A0ABX1PD70_9CYAN|nr:metalloregulator ArsR/SmtB family transcription factor [Brasilonema bromeliae]NMG22453.1 ArsR family transcriptional regulator [Brasilonema bromeliae SPC951]
MNNEEFKILLRFFKALADESRLKILGILANQECSVEELAALLRLKEPTISHHLARLKELNLVTMRPEGNARLYQLDNEALQTMGKEMFTLEKIASLGEDVDTEAWESKVVKTYIEGNHLKEIPTSRKKRLVILKWLASKFEEGITYPEHTVNEILKCYHPDYTTLRRELISYQLMRKENGVYWRFVQK